MNFKRIITLSVACFLLVGALAGCVSNEPGKTEPQNGDPTRPMLTNTIKWDIEEAYNAAMNKNIDWLDADQNRYYGTCGDYLVFFKVTHRQVKPAIKIDAYNFAHKKAFELYAIRDGELLKLKDVYDAGKVTKEQVEAVWYIHLSYYAGMDYEALEALAEQYVEPSNTDPTVAPIYLELSAEDHALVKAALKDHESLRLEVGAGRYRYYGTYNGCIILFFSGGDLEEMNIPVGEYTFTNVGAFSIYVIQNGSLCRLEDYYPEGDITEDQLERIYEIHASYG